MKRNQQAGRHNADRPHKKSIAAERRDEPSLHDREPLSETQISTLLFMREEEKLAMDLYDVLFATWGDPVFEKISGSESRHTGTIESFLEANAIPDPALDEVGVFTDPTLQLLYDDLVAQGSISLLEAYRVGALIEETDMVDLQSAIEAVDHAALENIYSNLMEASSHHLDAFIQKIEEQGESYSAPPPAESDTVMVPDLTHFTLPDPEQEALLTFESLELLDQGEEQVAIVAESGVEGLALADVLDSVVASILPEEGGVVASSVETAVEISDSTLLVAPVGVYIPEESYSAEIAF